MAQKKKKKLSKAEELKRKRSKAYLKKLESVLSPLAKKVIADMAPFRCAIILMDDANNAIARSSPDFSVEEFKYCADAIIAKNSTTL